MNKDTHIEKMVNLNNIEKVKKFVAIISNYEADFTLISGRYIIDAKSIMGVFSLDLSKDITLKVDFDNLVYSEKEIESLIKDFEA